MGYIGFDGDTRLSPSLKSCISIFIDTYKTHFFLQVVSVTTKDTVMYYYARYTVI
jgi:hypothetical protein